MNILTSKLIYITLAIGWFSVNADNDKKWRNKCTKTLKNIGHLNFSWNKTEAFMYAYASMVIPPSYETGPCHTKEAILYDYQRDLINEFLYVHTDYLSQIFDGPIEWCMKNHHLYGNKNKQVKPVEEKHTRKQKRTILNVEEKCIVAMNGQKLPEFLSMTHDQVLKGLFKKLDISYSHHKILAMQRLYMQYVGERIVKFVVYSPAKTPSEFCNKKESPAIELPVDEDGKPIYNPDKLESIQLPNDPSSPLVPFLIGVEFTSGKNLMEYYQGCESPSLPISEKQNVNMVNDPNVYQGPYQSDINNPSASSSGADKEFFSERSLTEYYQGYGLPSLPTSEKQNVNMINDPNVYQRSYQSDIYNLSESSSGADKDKLLHLDLNQPPPNEDN